MGMRSFSLSSWRHRRDGNINVRKCSFCICPACGPRGRFVTVQTFDKHTARMCADLLRPPEPESLAALYEEYVRRTQANDVPAQNVGGESDDGSDGYHSNQDCQWHGVDVEDEDVESGAGAPEPLAGCEPGDAFRSPHVRTRACEQTYHARTFACVAYAWPARHYRFVTRCATYSLQLEAWAFEPAIV